MPFYTYVVTYNDSNYVGQDSHSNFRGFVNAWCDELLVNALNGFTSNLHKELKQKAHQGEFAPLPNRKKVWQKIIDLSGKKFVIYAIETKK